MAELLVAFDGLANLPPGLVEAPELVQTDGEIRPSLSRKRTYSPIAFRQRDSRFSRSAGSSRCLSN